ncbi:MAG: methylenetetrahydrofolate reductase [Chloroflexi bacterium]|nr:methylenetetrahydrofolate reductase [Chloroflexota bacterium]
MAKVTERYAARGDRVLIAWDFSPPRGTDGNYLEAARHVESDFISVAYNPGKSVRVDSAVFAHIVQAHAKKDVIFNIATRDMNKLAIQSHLLGAAMLGLDNVVVVKGDSFSSQDQERVKEVQDYKPTELLTAISQLNQGIDYRGLKLRVPTDFCIGATLDLGHGLQREVALALRKAQAGAQFFLAQSLYRPQEIRHFYQMYQEVTGELLTTPVFWGLQVLEKGSLMFGDVPEQMKQELEKGRAGADIAAELLEQFLAQGIGAIYLIPPILKGGTRDYEAAQRVLDAVRLPA